ncbi:MAG TPA: hypothetical protein VMJ11_14400 [Paraburkholderia sp.]|uniref:phospholipase effector Tle1 domain-containing protein n=1 Tax=Paraburkholderia sp. TaxID=1926495 RepID=UPI002BEB9EB0|nr:hypothetical protein [Paraburkholderia sp.]HTR07808.1 hypothetical protein [Paraburkholderia sp.]
MTLFFDGTNNNDDPGNTTWRDSLKKTHTNVARLRNMAILERNKGIFWSYAPGVGTPFPEIGETIDTQDGKALAKGFNQRCVWRYAQLLNSVYFAITKDPDRSIVHNTDLKKFRDNGARNDTTAMKAAVHRLSVAHQ